MPESAPNSPTYPAPSAPGGWLTNLVNSAAQYYYGRNRLDQIAEEHKYQLAIADRRALGAPGDVSVVTAQFPYVKYAMIGGAAILAGFLIARYARK